MSKDKSTSRRLLSVEELNDFQILRPEFTSSVFKPKITFNYDTAIFNAACVRLFPESEYVQILVDPGRKRLLTMSCKQHDKASIRWSIIKNGKPNSRIIRGRILGAKIYRMMSWDIQCRYKIMAVYQELGGKRFTLFNLFECEMYVPEERSTDDGTGKKKRKKVFPIDWEKSFGTPYAEFSSTYDADIKSMHLVSNNTPDEMDEKDAIRPRVPKSSEIITSTYYTPDEIVKKGKKK